MSTLSELLTPVRRRLRSMLARGVVSLINDDTTLQSVQLTVLAGEVRDQVERFQQYGFTSVPQAGAEAILMRLGGALPIVIACDDRRYRLKSLEGGEVAMYTDEGDSIVIKRGGTIEVTAATKLHIDAPSVELTGDLAVGGDVTVDGSGGVSVGTGDVTAQGISLHDHRHPGVQAGGSVTGAPV